MRRVKANHATRLPSSLLCFDTETRQADHPNRPNSHLYPLRIGHARYVRLEGGQPTRRRELTFTRPEEFWTFVEEVAGGQRTLWVWAHSLGYDLAAVQFWERLEAGLVALQGDGTDQSARDRAGDRGRDAGGALVLEDPPTVLQARSAGGYPVVFVDSLNWCQRSLAKVGEDVGLAKLPMPAWEASDQEWETYCIRDVEVLEALVLRLISFVGSNDLGSFRFTSASQAWSAWRHTKPTPVVDFCEKEDVLERERDSYYGARQWNHFVGEVYQPDVPDPHATPEEGSHAQRIALGPVHHLDLTAAYASLMRDNRYPIRYLKTMDQPRVGQLRGLLEAHCLVARVQIYSQTEAFPVRRDGVTYHAVGRFWTVLATPELQRAIEYGCVNACDWCQLYSRGTPFKDFQSRMLDLRSHCERSGDALGSNLAKDMANALYGKFAQRPGRWHLLPGEVAPTPWGNYLLCPANGGKPIRRRSVGWRVQEERIKGERAESFPAISAHVTSYHREHMLALVRAAGDMGCVYEDADSLHVTQIGLWRLQEANLIRAGEPGFLRLVESAISAEYQGPKDFRFGADRVIAGIARKAIDNQDGTFTQEEFLRIQAVIACGPSGGPVVDTVVKSRPVSLPRCAIDPTGWTRPIHIFD